MPPISRRCSFVMPALLSASLAAAVAAPVHADAPVQVLETAATAQPRAPLSAQLHMGTSTSIDGHTVGINNQYLTYDGRPWLPVMGEFHYTRVPADQWEDEIEKMKASGLDIIATYVIWNHHEARAGQFDFSGDRDLHRFLELAKKHGMKVVLRLGPWAHGEVRFGGTPDWVVNQMPTRRNDPVYMGYVKRYWQHVFAQVEGLQFKDGGPVIGIQLENEYNLTGPDRGAAHISALKALARRIGFDTPLYTVTGWDGAVYPKGEVVPVFGGYPDLPWGVTTTMSPPNEVYAFRFTSRVAGDAGAQTKAATAGTAVEDLANTPFLGAEYAGGLPIMYRRRPFVRPADIGAMLPVQLGSGVNLYGYYMYHGGRNPQGDTTLEENALLGGYNDTPKINYDFQAPFGQYGEAHDVLGTVRPFSLFLNAFGDRLAPMAVHPPALVSKGPDDLQTPRYSVRSLGEAGFVFFNSYVRQHPMTALDSVQFKVDLPDGPLVFPSKPIRIEAGAYFIWPFDFDLEGVRLAWASAQPVTRIDNGHGGITYVFEAHQGIAPEFAFAGLARDAVTTTSGSVSQDGARIIAAGVSSGRGVAISLHGPKSKVDIVVLDADDARRLSQVVIDGAPHLILTKATVLGDGDLRFRSLGSAHFEFGVFPALGSGLKTNLPLRPEAVSGIFQMFAADAPQADIGVTLTKVREDQPVPPVNIGGRAHAALQPYPETYGRSAAWSIALNRAALKGLSNAYLKISYQGDVARLFAGPDLLDDDFWYGPAWTVGLKRFQAKLDQPLTLTVLPLRADAPVYIDDLFKVDFGGKPQVARVASVEAVPEYELDVSMRDARTATNKRRR